MALVLHTAVLLPALAAGDVAWHIYLWPALAPALAAVPTLGHTLGAAAWARAAARPMLPIKQILYGRLELAVGVYAAARASSQHVACVMAAQLPLADIAAALHSRARARACAAAAGRNGGATAAAATRHCLLSANAGLAAGPAALPPPPPMPLALAPPPPPPPPPPQQQQPLHLHPHPAPRDSSAGPSPPGDDALGQLVKETLAQAPTLQAVALPPRLGSAEARGRAVKTGMPTSSMARMGQSTLSPAPGSSESLL